MSKERYLEQEINKDLRILDLERQLKEAREVAKDAVIQLGYYSACGGTQATEFLQRNREYIKELKEKYGE